MKNYIQKYIISITAIAAIAAFVFYLFCVNHVGPNEVGVTFDSRNGKIELQPHAGWYVTSPFVRATTLSLLPQRVDITISGSRALNVKLIRLKKDKILDFVQHQGFEYYGFNNTTYYLRGYSFSDKKYDFIEEIK